MKKYQSFKYKWPLLALALLIFCSGCKNEKLIQPGDTLPIAYKKAMWLYRNQKYDQAINAFQTVINAGRGTDYGQYANYYLADTYFKDKQYLLSGDAFQRYVMLFPQSDKAQMAQFNEAISYYKLSPRYRISQKYTHTAIEKFKLFIAEYPQSDKVDEAGDYIAQLRTKLAHKMYHAADLYDRLDQYEAAVVYYDKTLNNFPETEWAERALTQLIETYLEYASKSVPWKKIDRYEKAVAGYEQYLQLFPTGSHRKEVESYVNQARDALANLEPVEPPKQEQDGATAVTQNNN